MKKLILLSLVLFVTVLAMAQTDKELLIEELESANIYVYKSTVKHENNKLYAWITTEYCDKPDSLCVDVLDTKLDIMYNTIKEYYLFDIKNNMYTILYKKYLDVNGIIQKTIKQNEVIADWEYIEPESKQQTILESLIDYY